MSVTFGVVVKVPPDGDSGNLAMALPLFVRQPGDNAGSRPRRPLHEVSPALALGLEEPVFVLGEILVLDTDGREFAGSGRKPSKWSVTVEYFDKIEDAVARAREVCGW